MDDLDDDRLPENGCWPSLTVPDDYSFVLFVQDEWYADNLPNLQTMTDPSTAQYARALGTYTKGIKKISKRKIRWTDETDPEMVFVDSRNMTRRATKEEMEEHFGLVMCETKYCDDVLRERGLSRRRPNEIVVTASDVAAT